MEINEAILKRRSIRSYKDIPITKDALIDIMESGQYAPCAGNLQNWRFVIVDDESMKNKIVKAALDQDWMNSAPVFIVICTKEDKMLQFYPDMGHDYNIQGAAAVAENMMLTATSHGLGSCWVGAFHPEVVADVIGCPKDFKPNIIITLGYSNEKLPNPCKIDLSAVTMRNGWGGAGRYKDSDWVYKDYSVITNRAVKESIHNIKQTAKTVHNHIKSKLKKKFK